MPDAFLDSIADSRSLPLAGPGPWRIGRGGDADICFPEDPACSRLQASISRHGDDFVLTALSRTSPLLLNGHSIDSETELHHGAVIAFAGQRLIFHNQEAMTVIGGPAGAYTQIAPPMAATQAPPSNAIALDKTLTVGRQAMPGQVVFDHPAISRRHAAFTVRPDGVLLRDLGSTNGTYVNGVRLAGSYRLNRGDRIDIGPFQLTFDGAALQSSSRTGNAELAAFAVSRDVPDPNKSGKALRILHDVTLRIRPRTLVCIMGASGSGKSTLMNILAGRASPNSGTVELNREDLHANFSALKQDVAFVPQQDVLHEQLTLRQALDYAAQLRLPPDTTTAQRKETVEAAARSVDLLERLETKIALLSGGQKKRASLASEILNRPSLLFLDEVTSGLDESTDWEIMRLLRRLAEEGMTIVAVTHTLANVEEFCHEVICMGRGGHMTFAGSPADALTFFNTKRLGELFNRMEEGGPESWREKFEQRSAVTRHRMAPGGGKGARTAAHMGEPKRLALGRITRQFRILIHRNTRLLLGDRRTLGMAAAQSLLIGGLMGYAFGTFGVGMEKVNAENALLLLLGLCAIWLGCNAASKDIVGELVIYRRERDINLSTAAFVASKYVVSSVFTMLQLVVSCLLVAVFAEAIPGGFFPQLGLLLIGAAAGTAIGLVISAFADTRDQATTIVPLALVPQLILAGVLVPKLPAFAEQLAKVAVSGYWLTEAMKSVFIAASGPILVMNAKTGSFVPMAAQPASLGAAIVAVHGVAFLAIAYGVTLFRNRRKGA